MTDFRRTLTLMDQAQSMLGSTLPISQNPTMRGGYSTTLATVTQGGTLRATAAIGGGGGSVRNLAAIPSDITEQSNTGVTNINTQNTNSNTIHKNTPGIKKMKSIPSATNYENDRRLAFRQILKSKDNIASVKSGSKRDLNNPPAPLPLKLANAAKLMNSGKESTTLKTGNRKNLHRASTLMRKESHYRRADTFTDLGVEQADLNADIFDECLNEVLSNTVHTCTHIHTHAETHAQKKILFCFCV